LEVLTAVLFLLLVFLVVAMFIDPSGFQNIVSYALVAITVVYAWATVTIARANRRTIEEMKQSRLDAVKPALSLQPGLFTHGGGFGALYLANSGGFAKDVKINVQVTKPELKKSLFVPPIDREHKVHLQVDDEAQKLGGVIKVDVHLKDGYNQSLSESLLIDFSDLKQEGREVWPQDSELSEVRRDLKEIAGNIGNIKRK
jgi:Ca2+/Na+ antiporter